MIASISFRRFRALRDTQLKLGPCNLVLGPNGSGKTSLVDALVRFRTLAKLPLRGPPLEGERDVSEGPEITFHFDEPFAALEVVLSCLSDRQCDLLQVVPLPSGLGADDWATLRARVMSIRSYVFDHHAISGKSLVREGAELTSSGGNLAAFLHRWPKEFPQEWGAFQKELRSIFPEYRAIETRVIGDGTVELWVLIRDEPTWIAADQLSQGTLYFLALLALAFQPSPPSVIALEEIDRGIHPRLFRPLRDLLYRLSYPKEFGLGRPSCQVVATTHSPHILDLFRDHPEEVVISTKHGAAARFDRLTDHPLWETLLATEGTLGDLWYSGVLGGVPEDPSTL